MIISILGSSSAGNCYILRGVQSSLLLEAGLPIKSILSGLNHDISSVCGCLLSHEHGDHSKSAEVLSNKGIDLYASKGTFDAIGITGHRVNPLRAKQVYQIGEFDVMPFEVQHDATDPFGYLIQNRLTKEKVLFATDTYYIKYRFSGVTCYMVECNYSEAILQQNIASGVIPKTMADRTRRSHFELDRCVEFLKASDLARTKKILLLHMSSGNSDAKAFSQTVSSATGIDTRTAEPGLSIKI